MILNAELKSPKTFEFHKFVEGVLQTKTQAPFLIANQDQFSDKSPDYPFRNYFYGIGLVQESGRKLRIGIEDFTLQAGDLLVIGPGIIRHWLDSDWHLKSIAFFFTSDLFTSPILSQPLADSPIFRTGAQHIMHLNDTDINFYFNILDQIKTNQNLPNVVAALATSLILKTESLLTQTQLLNSKSPRKKQIAQAFCNLINTQYLENKEVSYYAEKLNITPKYLSEVIKEETGKSPKNLLEQLLMQEAKSLLKQTEMNIKEISYWLGFDDPSYFTKAFKVSEGVLPNEYRK